MRIGRSILAAMAAAGMLVLPVVTADHLRAEPIANPVAVFSGLDKITGTITSLQIALNDTVRFGELEVTPRVCYSRPPTEEPKTTTFVEIDEVGENGKRKRIFAGWMFAESPGLNALEHPIFDIWLTGCIDPAKAPEQTAPQTGREDTPQEEIPKDTD
jgi:hypothetical protein